MLRKLCTLSFVLAFAFCITGCAEPEYKVTDKKESQTESTPHDVSPGEMVVE